MPTLTPAVHFLKTWQPFFREVHSGEKTFELRYDDRGYAQGDRLVLQAYNRYSGYYEARELLAQVTYILRHYPGLTEGWVVLGTAVLDYQQGPVCVDSQAFGYQRPGVEADQQLPPALAQALCECQAAESRNRQRAVRQGFYARYYGFNRSASPYSDAGGYGRGGEVTQANGWQAGWATAAALLPPPQPPTRPDGCYGKPLYDPGEHISWSDTGNQGAAVGNGIVVSVAQEGFADNWVYLVTNHYGRPQHVRQQFVKGLFVF